MSDAGNGPLVSCIMPTHNRRRFVPQAIAYFQRQDYPRKELIVVDDGGDPVADLIPDDARIRYVRLDRKATVGAKRNLACEQARGPIIAHWDDDDWHAPDRLRRQVEALRHQSADLCGINNLLFYEIPGNRAWQYTYPADQRLWLSGSTLCYTRAFWSAHPFPDVDVGEDACFVWSGHPECMAVVPDPTFHVGIIHGGNASPKLVDGPWWQPYPSEAIQRLLGADWAFYHPDGAKTADGPRPACYSVSAPPATQIRNVFACLVHENQECVVDLVRNLAYLDPSSTILVYNGGQEQRLLDHQFPFDRYSAVVHPDPRPLSWGRLHDFALDCMRFALENVPFDTLTIVDSDQLGARPGYSRYLAAFLAAHPQAGLLVNSPQPQPPDTQVPPAAVAFAEIDLWRPFLRRFPDGERKFVHWSFWPSTVFTAAAARDLTSLFATDAQLQDIMRRTRIWATEEVILPTMVALLGHQIVANPCSYDFVQYRVPYSLPQIEGALGRRDVFWFHPIPRRYDDPLRQHVRVKFGHYERPRLGPAHEQPEANHRQSLLLTMPILAEMSKVEGWLEPEEADLLIGVAARALGDLGPLAVVEVGSYCGRATVVLASVVHALSPEVKVTAVDPHDGRIGALDQGIRTVPPTLDKLKRNLRNAGLARNVEIVPSESVAVPWSKPICFLLVDGLHDYVSVAKDFYHFEPWLVPGGYVAFHDYADYYPGVKAFVNELLSTPDYRQVHFAGSMMVVRKRGDAG